MSEDLLRLLGSLAPATLYLCAVVVLWRKVNELWTEQRELVDRYHALVTQQVTILTKLNDELERLEHGGQEDPPANQR